MFGGGMGSWWVSSKQDLRWNRSGRASGAVSAGGPPELQQAIDELKKLYGVPPSDCEIGFMKD